MKREHRKSKPLLSLDLQDLLTPVVPGKDQLQATLLSILGTEEHVIEFLKTRPILMLFCFGSKVSCRDLGDSIKRHGLTVLTVSPFKTMDVGHSYTFKEIHHIEGIKMARVHDYLQLVLGDEQISKISTTDLDATLKHLTTCYSSPTVFPFPSLLLLSHLARHHAEILSERSVTSFLRKVSEAEPTVPSAALVYLSWKAHSDRKPMFDVTYLREKLQESGSELSVVLAGPPSDIFSVYEPQLWVECLELLLAYDVQSEVCERLLTSINVKLFDQIFREESFTFYKKSHTRNNWCTALKKCPLVVSRYSKIYSFEIFL